MTKNEKIQRALSTPTINMASFGVEITIKLPISTWTFIESIEKHPTEKDVATWLNSLSYDQLLQIVKADICRRESEDWDEITNGLYDAARAKSQRITEITFPHRKLKPKDVEIEEIDQSIHSLTATERKNVLVMPSQK